MIEQRPKSSEVRPRSRISNIDRFLVGLTGVTVIAAGGLIWYVQFAPRDRTPIRLTTEQALQIEGHNIWQYRPDTLLISDIESSIKVSYGELRTKRLIDEVADRCGLPDPLPSQGTNDFSYLALRTTTLNCTEILKTT